MVGVVDCAAVADVGEKEKVASDAVWVAVSKAKEALWAINLHLLISTLWVIKCHHLTDKKEEVIIHHHLITFSMGGIIIIILLLLLLLHSQRKKEGIYHTYHHTFVLMPQLILQLMLIRMLKAAITKHSLVLTTIMSVFHDSGSPRHISELPGVYVM